MALIPLVEYARKHHRHPDTAKQKAQRGGFKTAVKIGRDWLIDEDEPYRDNRRTRNNAIIKHRIT